MMTAGGGGGSKDFWSSEMRKYVTVTKIYIDLYSQCLYSWISWMVRLVVVWNETHSWIVKVVRLYIYICLMKPHSHSLAPAPAMPGLTMQAKRCGTWEDGIVARTS